MIDVHTRSTLVACNVLQTPSHLLGIGYSVFGNRLNDNRSYSGKTERHPQWTGAPHIELLKLVLFHI